MNSPRKLRADIFAIMDRLVTEGVVASYQTNLSEQAQPAVLEVSVQALPGSGPEEKVVQRVTSALADVAPDAAVVLEPADKGVQRDRPSAKLIP